MKCEKILQRVYNPWRLRKAWRQIKENAGAAGIDKMTVEDFEKREEELLGLIQEKLREGNYRLKPARRKLIPKEGSSKMRKLGIPLVIDRVAAQSAIWYRMRYSIRTLRGPILVSAVGRVSTGPLGMFNAS